MFIDMSLRNKLWNFVASVSVNYNMSQSQGQHIYDH